MKYNKTYYVDSNSILFWNVVHVSSLEAMGI